MYQFNKKLSQLRDVKMDVLRLCRSCMREVAIEEKNFSQDTVNMFTFCTNIPVRSEEQLPRQFCNQCTSIIQSCYTFVYTAREVDQRLKAMIGIFKPENSYKLNFNDIQPEELGKLDEDPGFNVEIKIEPVLSLQDTNQDDGKHKKRSKYSKSRSPKSNPSEMMAGQLESSIVEDPNLTHPTEFKTYVCTTCSKSFVRKKNYENHMFSYHSVEIPPLTAKDIKASGTTNSEDLAILEYPCRHCPEKFETSKDRLRHNREKHRSQVFECPHCPRKFVRHQLLVGHVRRHTRTKQFTCHYCNKVFKVKSRLKLHLHMHDDTLKPHLCDFCGSRYSHRHAMLNHQLVHTGQKPFTCDLCGYTCRQASNIRRHKRAHLNERKHQCVECGKGFNELSQLKKHMYAHTGERPYKCPNCDNSYKNSGKRKIHLIRVHGLDPSEIPRLAKDGGPARRYVTDDSPPKKQCHSLFTRIKMSQTVNPAEGLPTKT